MRKYFLIMIMLLVSVKIYADDMSDFTAAWKQWKNEFYVKEGDNLVIGKKVNYKHMMPSAIPSSSELLPDFGPYGYEWDADMAVNGSQEWFRHQLDKLQMIFSPDNLDVMIAIGGGALLDSLGIGAVTDNIDRYLNLAQRGDVLLATIFNHRFQLGNSLILTDNDDLLGSKETNAFLFSANETMERWESNVMNRLEKRHSKGIKRSNSDIVNVYNYIKENNKSTAGYDIYKRIRYVYGISGNNITGIRTKMRRLELTIDMFIRQYINTGRSTSDSLFDMFEDAGIDKYLYDMRYKYKYGNKETSNSDINKIKDIFFNEYIIFLLETLIANIDTYILGIDDNVLKNSFINVKKEIEEVYNKYKIEKKDM